MSGLASLTGYTVEQLSQIAAQQYASSASQPANTGPGSGIGSYFRANALMFIVILAQLNYVSTNARLQSIPDPLPSGDPNPDCDSFLNQFGFQRQQASQSTGAVTFSTTSAVTGNPLLVPVGVIVQTSSGLQFAVIADTSNESYNPTANGYYIQVGSSTVSCTVQCLTPGIVGNVNAGDIDSMFTGPGSPSAPGISQVANAADFTNALPVEVGAALKTRFANWFATGKYGTIPAINAAVAGTQTGLTYSIGDAVDASGDPDDGEITIYVNVAGQASAPPSSLLAAVKNNVLAIKAGGPEVQVLAPSIDQVNGAATIVVASGQNPTTVVAAVVTTYQNYVNGIGLDPAGGSTTLSFGKTYAALLAVPGVSDIKNLELNSATVDVVAAFGTQLVAGTTTGFVAGS